MRKSVKRPVGALSRTTDARRTKRQKEVLFVPFILVLREYVPRFAFLEKMRDRRRSRDAMRALLRCAFRG